MSEYGAALYTPHIERTQDANDTFTAVDQLRKAYCSGAGTDPEVLLASSGWWEQMRRQIHTTYGAQVQASILFTRLMQLEVWISSTMPPDNIYCMSRAQLPEEAVRA